MKVEEKYMRRALQLARNGRGTTSPNPMVGAVIVHNDRIIGEGWHRVFGEAHAEVNAVNSVREEDRELLNDSTMYVTLEPCSHYGKTPPCARLIVEKCIPRVVIATLDPFVKVAGRGVSILKENGVETEVGLLGDEARVLNKKFFTAHTKGRPFVLLKWAQSADGYLAHKQIKSYKFSDSVRQAEVHQLRSEYDAIMVGAQTAVDDSPRLDVRMVSGRNPRAVIMDRHGLLNGNEPLLQNTRSMYVGPEPKGAAEWVKAGELEAVLKELYGKGIISVMVEGGARLLREFLATGLWDEKRVEVSDKEFGNLGTAFLGAALK